MKLGVRVLQQNPTNQTQFPSPMVLVWCSETPPSWGVSTWLPSLCHWAPWSGKDVLEVKWIVQVCFRYFCGCIIPGQKAKIEPPNWKADLACTPSPTIICLDTQIASWYVWEVMFNLLSLHERDCFPTDVFIQVRSPVDFKPDLLGLTYLNHWWFDGQIHETTSFLKELSWLIHELQNHQFLT